MSWSGVKKQSYEQEIKSWCEEMGVKYYTINSKGEIDVDGNVNLEGKNFKELPYKFGKVNGWISVGENPNLISLKNCPNEVGSSFDIDGCSQLSSLEGCPKKVGGNFYCRHCKCKFTKEEITSLCVISKNYIYCNY